MTLQGLVGPFRLFGGVDAEYDAGHLFLAGPLGIGVEETKIRDEMLFVVLGDLIRPGNLVGYDRVHLGLSVVRIFGPVDDLI